MFQAPLTSLMQPSNEGIWLLKILAWTELLAHARNITDRDNGSFVDSLKSAIRILVGSARAPAPVADNTFNPLRTHAARSDTYHIWFTKHLN